MNKLARKGKVGTKHTKSWCLALVKQMADRMSPVHAVLVTSVIEHDGRAGKVLFVYYFGRLLRAR